MSLGIVIPCYNESSRLVYSVFENFLKKTQKISLCFVNDGSTDKTAFLLKKFHQKQPDLIHVINLEQNKGKANAVTKGMIFFFRQKKYKRIAFLDADLSTSLEECYELSNKINLKTKFVFASRVKKLDNEIKRHWYRFIMGRILATFISRMLNLSIYDTQCGCKVFKEELIPVVFCNPFLSEWLFDVEVFYRLKNYYGTKQVIAFSKENPLKSWVDMGDSKIKLSYAFWVWIDLIKIYKFYK